MKRIICGIITACLLLVALHVPAQSGFKTFHDTVGLYSFTYAGNFEIEKLSPASVLITSPLSSEKDKYRETLTINLGMAPPNVTIDSIASLLLTSMQRTYLIAKDIKTEKISIGGYEGRKISMTVMDKQLVSVSESFALIKGVFMRLSYKNEFQPDNSVIVSFGELIESIKIK
jgi:hypothetical protein